MAHRNQVLLSALAASVALALVTSTYAQRRQTEPAEPTRAPTSYAPTIPDRPFAEVFRDMSANKDAVMRDARAARATL